MSISRPAGGTEITVTTRSVLFPSGTNHVPCVSAETGTATTPTVHNVDSINVINLGVTFSGEFAPGKSPEDGAPEIELSVGVGGTIVTGRGVTEPGDPGVTYRAGATADGAGANLNAGEEDAQTADVDLRVPRQTTFLLGASAQDDTIDASGGPEFTGPLPGLLISSTRTGNDIVRAGLGGSQVVAGEGDDQLVGGESRDELDEGLGNDVVSAAGGDDRVFAGPGDDLLDGGAGRDQITFQIYGPPSPDQTFGPISFDLSEPGPQQNPPHAGTDTQAGFEDLQGTFFDDWLRGDDGKNHIDGREGDDLLVGRDGDDDLSGGLGDDRLVGGFGADWFDAFRGDDRITGNEGDDELFGGRNNDRLNGGIGSDSFTGGPGLDELLARDGIRDRKLDCGGGGRETVRRDRTDPPALEC